MLPLKLRNERGPKKLSVRGAIVAFFVMLNPQIALSKSSSVPIPYNPSGWAACGQRLLHLAKQGDVHAILSAFQENSAVTTSGFLSYLHAMAYVESRFQHDAVSSAAAVGILQLTPVGAQDAAEECGLPCPAPALLKVKEANIKYSSCLLRKYLRESGGNWKHALILYNGGYVQLDKFKRGVEIHPETQAYVEAVLNMRSFCLSH